MPPGTYNLTRINALNALNQNFNIEQPLNPVPIASFTLGPGGPVADPPMALTAFTVSPFRFSGVNSGFFPISATVSTASPLNTIACTVTINPSVGSPFTLQLGQASYSSTAMSAIATGSLAFNDPAVPNGSFTIAGIQCSNTGNQSLNVNAANFPGGSPAALVLSRCALPPSGFPSASSDLIAPAISCLSLPVSSVNVSQADQSVSIQFGFTDYESGAVEIETILTAPTGLRYRTLSSPASIFNGLDLVAVNIPRYAPAGAYALSIRTKDRVGNTRTYSQSQLATLGFPNTLQVADSNPDTVAPTMTAFSFIPSQVDVSASAASLKFQASLADNLSGVASSGFLSLRIPGESFRRKLSLGLTRISGNSLNGLWEGTISMPQLSFAGTYTLETIEICDAVQNCTELDGAPFAASVVLTSNPTDLQRPKLLYFDFTPKVINTTLSDQVITYISSWSDDISGIRFQPNIVLRSPSSGVSLTGPSTCSLISSGSVLFTYPRSATYRCTISLPQRSEAGQWTIAGLGVADAIGFAPGPFGTDLDTATLTGLGFPTRFTNITGGSSPDGSVGPAGGSVSSSSFPFLNLTSPAGLFTNLTNVYLRSGSAAANFPVPQGFSAAASNLITVDFEPLLSANLAAPGVSLTLPTSSTLPFGTNLVLFRLDPFSGNLTPAPSLLGGFATAFVNPGGNSVTFNGLASFPSFVAFRRNNEVLGDVSGDGVVNCTDIAIVKASLGRRINQSGFDSRADLNRDGVVDIRDLTAVSRQLPSGLVCP